jgi:hypothetical protein
VVMTVRANIERHNLTPLMELYHQLESGN